MEEYRVRELCRQYTTLSEEEITRILNMAALLQPMADLEEADMFIDCPMANGDALVVAEAKPTKTDSSYKNTVVGLFARQEDEPAVARTFRLGIGTRQMKAMTQEMGTTIQTVEPIRHGEKIIGVLIREKKPVGDMELNDKIRISDEGYEKFVRTLAQIDTKNSWLTECIDEALLMVNHEGEIIFRNQLAAKLYMQLGYVDDIKGQQYANVRLSAGDSRMPSEGYFYEEALVGHRVVSLRNVPVQSEQIAFAVLMRDITRQKEQEKALILKSVAVREMHHRIKNSLQTIVSLLRLQIRRTDSEKAKEVLSESMMRIQSIAGTHELLAYEVDDDVLLEEVLINLKNHALRAYTGTMRRFTVSVEGGGFKVDSDIATSVALVVNELVQNALKYAFKEDEEGHIRIIVTKGELYSGICVADDGCGILESHADRDQLGLTIVRTMVKDKLQGGEVEIQSDSSGTKVSFQFLNRMIRPAE